jgi:hypothetical protein
MNRRAAISKTAAKDIAEFKAWCEFRAQKLGWVKGDVMRGYRDAQLIKLLEKLGLERLEKPQSTTKPGSNLELHERVEVKESTNPLNQDECKQYQGKFGEVVEVIQPNAEHPDGAVVVKMLHTGSPVVIFDGLPSGKPTGLYRSKPTSPAGKKILEVIYFKEKTEKPTDLTRVKNIDLYMQRSRGTDDQRDRNYYVGNCNSYMISKEGNVHFLLANCPQRGGEYASITEKGAILYVGLLNHRPSGWMKELEEMLATNS